MISNIIDPWIKTIMTDMRIISNNRKRELSYCEEYEIIRALVHIHYDLFNKPL